MPNQAIVPLNELRHRGLKALFRELGPVGMARFLQQFDTGRGDYTRDRDAWLGDPNLEEITEELRELRERKAGKS